jgi:hypothetical protein
MSAASHLQMHRDHLRWCAQNDLWRDDLAIWEGEVQDAIHVLPQLEKALHKHLDALRQHAAAIRMVEQDFNEHEHALSEYERGEPSEELIQMAKAFERASSSQVRHKKRHEEIRHEHHNLLARWRQLVRPILQTKTNPR